MEKTGEYDNNSAIVLFCWFGAVSCDSDGGQMTDKK